MAVTASTLRVEWSSRSLAASWAFPSDWDSPAVDAVCEALAGNGDVFPAAERLGRVRAASGVALGETLADIDQLIALVHPRHAEMLRRAVSLGWADRVVGPGAELSDPLTGLASRDYLMLRLAEVYASCGANGLDPSAEYALAVVRVELATRSVWQRVLPMIHIGESMRVVFDAGESLARLGEPMAVALTRRTPSLDRRVQLLARLIATRTSADPDAQVSSPRVWVETLPSSYQGARALLTDLGR